MWIACRQNILPLIAPSPLLGCEMQLAQGAAMPHANLKQEAEY